MFARLRRYFFLLRLSDGYLFLGIILLISFSLSAIYSLLLSQETPDFSFFQTQLIATIIGVICMTIVSLFDYRFFLSASKYLYLVAIIFLISVLLFGVSFRGTQGWLQIGGWHFQIVEGAKIALLLFLAHFFSHFGRKLNEFRYIFVSGLITVFLFFLVLLQPDFGSAVILFLLWLGYILIIGIKKKYIFFLVLTLLISISFGWFFFLKDYQKERVRIFLYPERDPLGQGYNISQAQIAIGSGQWFGRGIGFGPQSQLRFLPAAHTDFIIAVIAEELGFAGIMSVLFLYGLVFYRVFRMTQVAQDDPSVLLLLGIILLLFSEMFINIGMNIGLLPVAGIALPFLSYGGSSLVSSLFLIGLAQSVIIHKRM